MKLNYIGYNPNAKGYGWATCNRNLVAELSKLCEVTFDAKEADVHFVPIADHNLEPVAELPTSGTIIGYTFFEFGLGRKAKENAKKYDIIFAGSTYCADRMKLELGINNVEVLIQGVDKSIFRRIDMEPDGKFHVFSGGKFECRKGQRELIQAWKLFSDNNPDAFLHCCWHNPWPQLCGIPYQENQPYCFERLMEREGIGKYNFKCYGELRPDEMAQVMNRCEVGVFPNQCEGGTNLVMMEFMACNKSVIATLGHGHRDVFDEFCDIAIPCVTKRSGWTIAAPRDIAASLEDAYSIRKSLSQVIRRVPTWKEAAEKIYKEASGI